MRLFETLETRRFDSTQEEAWLKELRQMAADVTVDPVGGYAPFILNEVGQTPSGSFTIDSLRHLCGQLGFGLFSLVESLCAGVVVDDQTRLRCPELARTVFNDTLRARFSLLADAGFSVVLDRRQKLILGWLGPDTAYVANEDVADLFLSGIESAENPLQFDGAAVRGHRAYVRYVECEPSVHLVSDEREWTLALGMGFQNNAVAPEALRFFGVYGDVEKAAYAMNRSTSVAMRRVGSKFISRLTKKLGSAVGRATSPAYVRRRLEAAATMPLGLQIGREDGPRRLDVVRLLARLGLPKDLGERVVSLTALPASALYRATRTVPPNFLESRRVLDAALAAAQIAGDYAWKPKLMLERQADAIACRCEIFKGR